MTILVFYQTNLIPEDDLRIMGDDEFFVFFWQMSREKEEGVYLYDVASTSDYDAYGLWEYLRTSENLEQDYRTTLDGTYHLKVLHVSSSDVREIILNTMQEEGE